MTAPLGVRRCPVLGCGRRIHVSASGIVYARCLAHTLMLTSGAFASQAPGSGGRGVPPVPRPSLPVAPVAAAAGSRSRG